MVEEMNQEHTEVKILEVGDEIKGTVTKIEEKQALVDVGYKVDAILPISEVSNLHIETIGDILHEGDEAMFVVKKVTDEELVISKRMYDSEKAWDELQSKLTADEVFEVVVADVVKGGLVVDVGLRGFIPASLVERHFVEDFGDYKGRTLRVKVVELDKENNKVILSQKAVLDEEYEQEKLKVYDTLKEGSIVEGTVQRLTDFGAFVDVGGVDGLVHISEMAWHHVEKPSDMVKEGDKVQVKVLKVDKTEERISLSMKAAQASPWDQAGEKFHVGDVVQGTVKRLVPFGAFVELLPGVEGLVHISQISHKHIGTPSEVLKEEEVVDVKVLDVNIAEKRISLSIRELLQEEPKPEPKAAPVVPTVNEEGMNYTLGERFAGLEALKNKLK
ncbi:30S ribosomal protein S1 [Rubeoparvulum massiliense]|uniref:30S ribosomal protein S1 n=1 Tax=Rubeoparvulum massiliense TaxID=1631346 RepID=UPI00065DF76C|nr:30S ribosomal protein S1 [Rubeoparvulum massiliense]